MDISKILAELNRERELLVNTILVLERLVPGTAKRRGRPPRWMQELKRTAGVEINAPQRHGQQLASNTKTLQAEA